MKKTIYFCDRCGKEIPEYHNKVTAAIATGRDIQDFEFDLCFECAPEFLSWFKVPENTPPQRKIY